jgi:hypothetical protein
VPSFPWWCGNDGRAASLYPKSTFALCVQAGLTQEILVVVAGGQLERHFQRRSGDPLIHPATGHVTPSLS